MGIGIVEAGPEDLNALSSLFDQYRQFYKQESAPGQAKVFLSARLQKKDSTVFLAYLEDAGKAKRAVGFTQLYPLHSSVRMKPMWLLNDLFVESKHRQCGVARALMQHAERWAMSRGASCLMLQTAVDNLPAQRLYESLGWKRDNDFYSYYKF